MSVGAVLLPLLLAAAPEAAAVPEQPDALAQAAQPAEPDEPLLPDPAAVVFLSLLHAVMTSIATSATAIPDRTRTMVPPTRVVCSAGADHSFWTLRIGVTGFIENIIFNDGG